MLTRYPRLRDFIVGAVFGAFALCVIVSAMATLIMRAPSLGSVFACAFVVYYVAAPKFFRPRRQRYMTPGVVTGQGTHQRTF